MRARSARLNAVAIFVCVAGFACLEVAAMSLYPGGTWWDTTTQGHRFWENFLCDLEWRVALNKVPNPVGSRLAMAAMLVLVAGLGAFWFALPAVFAAPAPRGAHAVRWLGITSTAGALAVVLMPSDRFGALHGVTVLTAGVPGILAAGLAIRVLAVGEPRPPIAAWVGASMLAFGFVDFALYAWHFLTHTEGTILGPALQKVALILLLAWMILVGLRVGSVGGFRPQRPG
jgi:hypothetical protein